jgi:hypothetical protein
MPRIRFDPKRGFHMAVSKSLIKCLFITVALSAQGLKADPSREIVGKMIALHLLTEADLSAFDQSLEVEGFELSSSEEYQRLLAARSVLENLEGEFFGHHGTEEFNW